MAAINFIVTWIVVIGVASLALRKLGLTPSSRVEIILTRAFPIVLSACNVALFLRQRVKKRRIELNSLLAAAGLICTCGYDLTGNVSGVCPECGTALQTEEGQGAQ